MAKDSDRMMQRATREQLIETFGDEKTADEFIRFRDKELQRETRKEIEFKVEDILEGALKTEYDTKMEAVNKVYRKAWSMACKELELDEAEFPSKY